MMGPKKESTGHSFNKHHIILASYTAIRLDIKSIKEIPFHLLILDEAQYVKNRTTNTFKAIKKVTAKKRLLLTRTL